jgi:hypothetical protein
MVLFDVDTEGSAKRGLRTTGNYTQAEEKLPIAVEFDQIRR